MEWVLLVVLAFVWKSFSGRIRKLESEREFQERLIRELTARVYKLETQGISSPAPAPPALPLPRPIAEPVPARSVARPAPPLPEPEPEPAPAAAFVEHDPWETIRSKVRGRDWEAVVGGSWLNAAGVLILVIGLSLFLGYALTQFGPAGKTGIGAATALAMLGAGAFIEQRERYRTLGRGLIAGGWASLYFTAFAAHAVPAARVIDSALVGGILLLVVAAGMIAHSLRYRSQNLTLLCFFAAFLALQLQPVSKVSIAASVPLTIAMLTISRSLGWVTIPVAGLLLTYFTFAFRFNAQQLGPMLGVAALYTYWVTFELYDLLRLRESWRRRVRENCLFPLNAMMLLGTAMLTLPPTSPAQSSTFLASLGVLFGISTWLRMKWGRRIIEPIDPVGGVLAQGFRIGVALSAAMFAGAILRRFPGIRAEIGWMLEGQLLVFAFLRTGDWIFKRCGQVVFAAALLHVLATGSESGGFTNTKIGHWVAVAFAMAALFYINRWLTRQGAEWTWPAAGLMLAAAAGLIRSDWTAAAWMAIALALVEASVRTRQIEFRLQALAVGALATLACCWVSFESRHSADVVGAAAVMAALGAWRWNSAHDQFRTFASAAGTLLAAWACWMWLPAPLVAVAWGAIGLALLELGEHHRWLAWQPHAVLYAAFGRTLFANFPVFGESAGLSHRVLTVVPLIALAWHAWRRGEGRVFRGYSYAGVILAAALMRFEFGRTLAVIGWAVMMLALYHQSLRRGLLDLRYQAYGLAALTFARSWATNFASIEDGLGISARLGTALVVIGAYHAAQFLTPRESGRERAVFALLGVALLGLVLYFEASGQMLTIAWGAQGVVTLAAGFAARERILRLAGLALFALCILKLFLFDLRNLETLARIASFIVLGLVLIGASWLYMRFREKIQRYL